MANQDDPRGIEVEGEQPQALLLSDGTRLALEDESGPAHWSLLGDDGAADGGFTVGDAIGIAGEEHADYVRVRTRAEVEWLRIVAEWFDAQAERLDRELATARP